MPLSRLQAPEPLDHEPVDEPARSTLDQAPGRRSLAYRLASGLGIATIVLVGGLFWLALGAFVSAWGGAIASFSNASADRTDHFLPPAPASASPADPVRVLATPGSILVAAGPRAAPTQAAPSPTAEVATPTPTPQASPQASPTPQATQVAADRAPWVLLPQPPPGARVPSGPLVLEARGRGDAPISDIRLELDGKPIPVAVDQRSDLIWRGAANIEVGSGHHSAKAFVVDAQGRTGSYGWTFDADASN